MKKQVFAICVASTLAFTLSAQEYINDTSPEQNYVDSTTLAESQTMPLFSMAKVKAEVDLSLFPLQQGGFYLSDGTANPEAFIMTLVIPQSYEEAQKGMVQKSLSDKQVKIESNKQIQVNGKTASYIFGSSVEDGKVLKTELYLIKFSDTQSILIVGTCQATALSKYKDAFSKAANSASIEQQ